MNTLLVLVFKVLYFFWLKAEKVEVRVEAPPVPGEQAGGLPAKAALSIHVAADGSLSFEGEKLALEALQQKLAARIGQEKDLAVVIRADAAAAYNNVVILMDACGKAGVTHLSFAAIPAADPGPQFEEEQD